MIGIMYGISLLLGLMSTFGLGVYTIAILVEKASISRTEFLIWICIFAFSAYAWLLVAALKNAGMCVR